MATVIVIGPRKPSVTDPSAQGAPPSNTQHAYGPVVPPDSASVKAEEVFSAKIPAPSAEVVNLRKIDQTPADDASKTKKTVSNRYPKIFTEEEVMRFTVDYS